MHAGGGPAGQGSSLRRSGPRRHEQHAHHGDRVDPPDREAEHRGDHDRHHVAASMVVQRTPDGLAWLSPCRASRQVAGDHRPPAARVGARTVEPFALIFDEVEFVKIDVGAGINARPKKYSMYRCSRVDAEQAAQTRSEQQQNDRLPDGGGAAGERTGMANRRAWRSGRRIWHGGIALAWSAALAAALCARRPGSPATMSGARDERLQASPAQPGFAGCPRAVAEQGPSGCSIIDRHRQAKALFDRRGEASLVASTIASPAVRLQCRRPGFLGKIACDDDSALPASA